MAAPKFKPKASTNIIEGATPVEETEVTTNPETADVQDEEVTPVKEEETVETDSADVQEETAESTEEKDDTPVEETGNDGENPETAPPAPEVIFKDTSEKKAPERNVKVVLKVDHSCSVGGERYHFERGKQYNVPASVKSILMQAGLLMPL